MDPITLGTLLSGIGAVLGCFTTIAVAAVGAVRTSRKERIEAARRAKDEERTRFERGILAARADGKITAAEAAHLLDIYADTNRKEIESSD